ncbi:hypothetical protein N7603_04620 [Acholeplasma vituli]|uniref:Uncharacterized protein n=1 Tax=Paracholeplasma vituli TaxID=69473 RepID=A0ABT2PVF5_9MOLU|nr:hypothetical protein [Paracholeplasma vituli]MCU0104935.1 hypothetical protein [Paracholeplasma vituli]
MKITDEAKLMLQDILKKENFNCVIAGLHYHCSCGDSTVQFGLGNIEDGDLVYTFNDIPVVMEAETLPRTELITIYVENGELMFLDEAEFDENESNCGCGHDHNHDHDHAGCDCGHDHDHEGECQCGQNETCNCGHEH